MNCERVTTRFALADASSSLLLRTLTRVLSPTITTQSILLKMAGFKRGGFRGGNSGGFKKSFNKKRPAEDEDDAPSASKKSRSNDEDEEDTTPFVPQLHTEGYNDPYIAVSSCNIILLDLAPDLFSSTAAAIDVSPLVTSKAPP